MNLTYVDHWLFQLINGEWTNSFFDSFFPFITDLHKNPFVHLLLIAFLVFWIVIKRTSALRWLVLVILSVGLSDIVAYRVVKPIVHKPRPQQSGIPVVMRVTPQTGDSFPSNHAANIFAAALSLSMAIPEGIPIFFAVAILVAYSRVYVGVHFPTDVIAGAILGMIITLLWRTILAKWLEYKPPRLPMKDEVKYMSSAGLEHQKIVKEEGARKDRLRAKAEKKNVERLEAEEAARKSGKPAAGKSGKIQEAKADPKKPDPKTNLTPPPQPAKKPERPENTVFDSPMLGSDQHIDGVDLLAPLKGIMKKSDHSDES